MPAGSKRLIIHAGMPKTGTTSIQNILRRRSARLKSFGVLYPGPEEDQRLDVAINHTAYFSGLTGRYIPNCGMNNLAECKVALSDLVEKFDRENNYDTLIISHESLAANFKKFDTSLVAGWQDNFDLSTVVYVRPMREWVESRYIQAIFARAMGQSTSDGRGDPRFILKGILRRIDDYVPSSVLANCKNLFPKGGFEFRSFIERRENDDLVEHFIKNVISNGSLSKQPINTRLTTKNASRPQIFTAFIHRLLSAGVCVESTREIVKRFTFITKEEGQEPPHGKAAFNFMSDEEFSNLLAVDQREAKIFPDLRLDGDVRRRLGSPSTISNADFKDFLDWLAPFISPAAAKEAGNVIQI